MSVHRLYRRQLISATLQEVWTFFCTASNLREITPAYMNFRVTSEDLPHAIYPGEIITYKVSPVLGISLFWMTEITHVIEGRLFVDEQRRGPYSLWHHQHHFEETPDGVLMTDIVHYQLPFGVLGELAHMLFVGKQLKAIFDYRKEKIETLFPGRK